MTVQRYHCQPHHALRPGAVLVEFALIALCLFIFLAATLDFGRAIHSAQVVQQAADVMARELSRTPLPATATFEQALQNPTAQAQIYNDQLLVVQMPPGIDIYSYAQQQNWPLVNQMLVPLMLVDQNGLAQYPGVAQTPKSSSGRYQVPLQLTGSGAVNLVPVVEQISPNANDPNAGPFSLTPTASGGPTPALAGYVALRINCPFQAAGTVAYTYTVNGQPSPGIPVGQDNVGNNVVRVPPGAGQPIGPYGGADGLGSLVANSNGDGTTVRPFRRLICGQAIFRRELFTANPTGP
jgi:hypothetical protein